MIKPGVIVGSVGVVLVIVGFVGPWWTVGFASQGLPGLSTDTSVTDFRLFGRTVTSNEPGGSRSNSTDYSNEPNTRAVFQVGAVLTGVAVGLGAVFVVLGAMADRKPTFRRIALVFGVLAFALALVAAVYVMAMLPGAVNRDRSSTGFQFSGFWGLWRDTFGATMTITWAAAWAWYAVVVGAVLFLVGAILAMRAPKAVPIAPPASPETP